MKLSSLLCLYLKIWKEPELRLIQEALNAFSKELQVHLDNYTTADIQLLRGGVQYKLTTAVQKILFDKLGLKTGKKTKTGFSTDAKVA
jgi:DNA polymerase I